MKLKAYKQSILKHLLFLGAVGVLFCPQLLHASGLVIPAGSKVNVNGGTFNINGDITIQGTLGTSAGVIGLHGDWLNATGTYTPGSGTVAFIGTGTQILNSSGTTTGKTFSSISHTGTGTLDVTTNDLDLSGDFNNTAGIVNTNGQNITIEGDWTNTATYNQTSGTVTFDGTTQNVVGDTIFFNFVKSVTLADTMVFDSTGTQVITGTLVMNGAAGQLLTITSDDDDGTPTQWGITLQAGGLQVLSFLNVRLSDASDGLTLVGGASSTDSGMNDNWVFGAADLVWDGDASTDWNNPFNWDLGFVPNAIDNVTIPGTLTNQPVLELNVTVNNVTVTGTANIMMDGFDFAITGTLSNEGTISLFGSESLTIGTNDTDSGTFEFLGDGNGGSVVYTLPDFGATDWYNLVINDSNATMDTFDTTGTLTVNGTLRVSSSTLDISSNSDDLVVNGSLTIDGGALTATTSNIDANGNVVITSGTLTAPNNTGTFTIAADFVHTTSGTFIAQTGTVTFDGTSQSITGDVDTWFHSFTKVVSVPDTFTFPMGSTQFFTGTLTMEGDPGNTLSIRSDGAGLAAPISLQPGGLQNLRFLNVGDSTAAPAGGLTLVARNSTNVPLGNTTNWVFGGATITWQGDVDNDWDNPSNWDLGIVPWTEDNAVVPDVAGPDPTLMSAIMVDELMITSNAVTVTAAGFNITIAGTLSNDGTISLFGDQTVSIGVTDTDSGTFLFLGDGNGTADINTLTDYGTIDYYNVIINDANATMDTFDATGTLTVAGTLQLTSSTLDISTNAADLNVTGSFLIINGGALTATNSSIDANGAVTVTSGTLTAPGAGESFTVGDDWNVSMTGTFVNSGGSVRFDTAQPVNLTGMTWFNTILSSIAGKNFTFESGTTQTVEGSMIFTGASGNEIVFRPSVAATQWFLNFPGSPQISQFIDVDYSTALTNSMTCFNCIENTASSTVNWIFGILSIIVPADTTTTDLTPTIIGMASAGLTVDIRLSDNSIVGSVVADANGNFRFEVTGANAISAGAETLTPFVGAAFGGTVNITGTLTPTTVQQPTIVTPADGTRVAGSMPTFTGFGDPGAAIQIYAADTLGNLNLTVVGTGTVALDGSYSISPTTPVTKSTVLINVVVSGVGSDIFSYMFVDPFGVVFDSIGDVPIENATVTIINNGTGVAAVPGVDIAATDVNPVITGTNGFYSFLTIPGNFTLTVTAGSYDFPSILTTFPLGRTVTTGSKGEIFTVNGTILEIDMPMDPSSNLLRIEKDANKKEVRIGDVVTYTIDIENVGIINAVDVQIQDKIPAGFKYLQDRVILDGVPIANPSGQRPVVFEIGDVNVGVKKQLKYQLVVGTGVIVGDYTNVAIAKHPSGITYSNPATETVTVVLDPLFDLGTTIGKVFYDKNENGIQDPPTYYQPDRAVVTEDPVPNVRIVMEDGTAITTDKEGRFSVPALTPGRHLFRLDERTLPDGVYLTTDKVVVVDITPALLVKVNFGVNYDSGAFLTDDQEFFAKRVKITQDPNKPKPRLHVNLFQDDIGLYNDVFVEKAEFRIFTNYVPFIERWNLEIIDRLTKKVIKRFDGDRLNIYDPIYWDGRDIKGEHIFTDRQYDYRLYVEDKNGKFDETNPRPITFKVLKDELDLEFYKQTQEEKRKEYKQWVENQFDQNNLSIQTILVDGETVLIDRLDTKLQNIQIMKDGKLISEVPVIERHGLTAQEILEGKDIVDIGRQRRLEVILPKGNFDVIVQEDGVIAEGQTTDVRYVEGYGEIRSEVSRPVKTYSKPLQVGEDQLFFVAMGDAKIGYTFTRGNTEPVQFEDRYQDGFWFEGKAAYYLQGKILGKYLVQSSFDTERERKEIFRNLDPETYYPVYGDQSEIDYSASDTQGNLYALVEWDKSSAIWGNYSVGFDDTEFGKFSRSLYGGKVDFESLSTNKYGDAKTKVIAFRAKAQQRSAHNEFLATGGSLYFLKHKYITEGSDKIKIEIRDKITGLVITSREMVESADYEMDYDSGRIIFWLPVPTLVSTYRIISDNLLDGNLVYVVADYEYEAKDKVDEATYGGRARQAIGENFLVGATYVEETLETNDYTLGAADVTAKFGKDGEIVAEFAQSRQEAQPVFISTDGGLSFDEIPTRQGAQGQAYGIRGSATLFNRLGTSAYYKWIENDFSTSATTSQQGKELLGFELVYDVTDQTRVIARQDIQRLLDDGNLQTQIQVGSNKTTTTMVNIVHQARRLKYTAEYRRTEDDSTDTEVDIVAARVDYQFNDRLIFSLEHQQTIGARDYQTTIGVAAKVTDKLTIRIQEVIDESGTATTIGLIADMHERLSLTADYSILTEDGVRRGQGTLGAIAKLNDRIQFRSSVGISSEAGLTYDYAVGGGAGKQLGSQLLDGEFGFNQDGATAAKAGLGGTIQVSGSTALDTDLTVSQDGGLRATTASVGSKTQLSDETSLGSKVSVTQSGETRSTAVELGSSTFIDDKTSLDTSVAVSEAGGVRTALVSIGGKKQVDDKTEIENKISFTETTAGYESTTFTFGTKKKLTEDILLATSRAFTNEDTKQSTDTTYSLSKVKDGKKLEGSLARRYSEDEGEVSRSNIFGLTGEIDDRWALTGLYERAEVENLDGTTTQRDVGSIALGYVKKDPETGLEMLKSSTKAEIRFDEGDTDRRQYLISSLTEGQITPGLSVFSKVEFSETRNLDTNQVETSHKEFAVGGAYRPIMHDRLNVLARYTYLENQSPESQEDFKDIEEQRAHVIAVEGIYDLTQRWQITEKFAYRIGEEKVTGFQFTQTHTWLMIHRLNYKINQDWKVGGEYRMLVQREAEDRKSGILIEASRQIGEYAQLGVGYDFTDFADDLTDLDYTTQGPFIRVTGKFYDRSPEEIERARQKWLAEKVERWAWIMVSEELARDESPILRELNDYMVLAKLAYEKGNFVESRQIYKDIIVAGNMMHEEAEEYIRRNIAKEEQLKEMKALADQYYKNGQFDKAKKILEKILEEAEKPVVK